MLCLENIWLKLGIKEENILPFGMKENFWEMDVVGPCGPCTEIHYDRNVNSNYTENEMKKARDLVNAGSEKVIELWNLVFMQYNRINKKEFTQLPNLVVDTGMGLERLAAVLNNLKSNYDTDLFKPLFKKIHECSTATSAYADCDQNSEIAFAYRVLADHIRSITIAISDGY